jgi:hypothetical protein
VLLLQLQTRKITVEVAREQRRLDGTELTMNNVLAMALNSKSSVCVQMLLDVVSSYKVRCQPAWLGVRADVAGRCVLV